MLRTRNILIFSLFIFISGCAGGSYHHYSGNHLPESDLAKIKPWKESNSQRTLDVFPVLIDGKVTETYRLALPSYFIMPGEHTIEVALFAGLGIKIKDPEPMTFKAKAGHTYITKAYLQMPKKGEKKVQVKVSFWLEDENTGEVVSGTKLTE